MRNVDGEYPNPEVNWTSGGTYAAPAITIDINGNLSVQFQHYNNSDKSGAGVFTVYLAELMLPSGDIVQLNINGQSYAMDPLFIPAHGTFDSASFDISGWDPCIHAGTLRIGYTIDTTGIPGLVGYGMTREWRFLVNLEPPVGHMHTVWHELLEETTSYAWGKDVAVDVANDLTLGLYYAKRFAYPTGTAGYGATWYDGSNFNLTGLLRTPGWVDGNCHDVAVYLHMLFQTQGLANEPLERRVERGPYDTGRILTNLICPIGSDPQLSWTYKQVRWTLHVVVNYAAKIYDACLALEKKPDLSDWKKPPMNWGAAQHWYTNHGTPFTGIAMRYLQQSELPGSFPLYSINFSLPHEQSWSEDTELPFGGPL